MNRLNRCEVVLYVPFEFKTRFTRCFLVIFIFFFVFFIFNGELLLNLPIISSCKTEVGQQ